MRMAEEGKNDVLYLLASNHVLEGIVDEVLGTLNLLQMNLGALEGQTRRDYFLDSTFDPSVNQCDGEAGVLLHLGARGRAEGRRAPSRAGLRPAVGARRRATTDPCPAPSRRERRPPRGPQGTGAAEHPAGPPPAHYPGSSAAP